MQSIDTQSLIGKRYQLHERLGEGGMGTVYRAVDRLTGQTAALKRVNVAANDLQFSSRPSDTSKQALFLTLAQEFQTLASLRHPNIVSVLTYGFDGAGNERKPFLIMELLNNAKSLTEAGHDASTDTKADLLIQTLQALAYLHRRAILHRDLKPGNVLVTTEDGAHRVRVVDFGVSVSREQAQGIAGTLAYMAPEVLMDQPIGEAADLYAVGVMAYELFAGRHPFDTGSLTGTLTAIINKAPDLSLLDGGDALKAVIGRLLTKQPASRYSSASAAIAAFCEAFNRPLPPEDAAVRESFLQASRLVGRDSELAQLREMLQELVKGKGSSWLIGGESGIGKSRLISELRTLALVRGVLVLRGQAISEAGAAYQMWRHLLRWLTLLTDPNDFEAGVLKAVIPDIADLLGRAVADAPPLDPQPTQVRLFSTVADLLRRRSESTILLLEDLHWAGEDALAMLTFLLNLTSELPLLILGSYRSDETPDLPQRLRGSQVMKLERLSEASIADLSESMLGEAGRNPGVITLLQHETEGNVFFVVEVVRALAEEAGQLAHVGVETLPEHVFAGGMKQIIQRRLNRVTPEDRPALIAAALAGRQLDFVMLGCFDRTLDWEAWAARAANAVVLETHEGRWRFAHDKLRDELLAALSEDERKSLHRRIAESIEAAYPDSADTAPMLAYHWGGAGDSKEAHYSALAGEQAADRYSHDEALRYLERALALTTDSPQRSKLLLQQALVMEFVGRLPDAQKSLQQALELASDDLQRGLCLREMAQVLWRMGNNSDAATLAEGAIATLDAIGEALEAARARHGAAVIYDDLGDKERCFALWDEAIPVLRRHGDRRKEGAALSGLGNAHFFGDRLDLSMSYFEQDLVITRELGDRRGEADSIGNIGNVHYMLGNYPAALECYMRQLEIVTVIGYSKGKGISIGNMGAVYHEQGYYEESIACQAQYLNIMYNDGGRVQMGIALQSLGETALKNQQLEWTDELLQLANKIMLITEHPHYLARGLVYRALAQTEMQRFAEAEQINNEALIANEKIPNADQEFTMRVLAIRLRAALQKISPDAAASELMALLESWTSSVQHAAIHYELWRLDKTRTDNRDRAAALYHEAYTATPNAEYSQRYEELTGKHDLIRPQLPPLPAIVVNHPIDLTALLQKVKAEIERIS